MIAPRTAVPFLFAQLLAWICLPSIAHAQCTSAEVPMAETTPVDAGAWMPATVPAQMTVSIATTIASVGSLTATVPNTTGLTVGAGVNGPNVAVGTTIASIDDGTAITLSQPSTGSGTDMAHTFTLEPYGSDVPPSTTGLPATVHCSVCPALFSAPICAGSYAQMYLCAGNIYTITLCTSAEAFNSTLTITNASGTQSHAYDDDGCGTTDGLSTVTFAPTQSQVYRMRVFTDPCTIDAGVCGTLEISCAMAPPPPANDEPWDAGSSTCTAVPLDVSTACLMADGSTDWATQSDGSPGCGAFVGMDVWFSAEVPVSGDLSVRLTFDGANDLAMAAYTASACSDAMTLIPGSCSADPGPGVLEPFIALSGLTGGSTVYIRVWPEAGAANSGTFQICAYEPTPPVNDEPCNSIDLPVGATCSPGSFTTEAATPLSASMTLSPPIPTCGNPVTGGDVWFQVTVTGDGPVLVSTQALILTDMAMAVYTLAAGSICGPGTLTEVPGGCNDNTSATDLMPSVVLFPTEATTYYVRVWNKTAAFGTFAICAQAVEPPVNDDPCGAIPLPVEHGCILTGFSNMFAALTAAEGTGWTNVPAPADPCITAITMADVWFTAVVPGNGELRFDTDDGSLWDAAMAIYKPLGSCGTGDLNLTQVGCATGGSANGSEMPSLTVTDLTPGATVYVRVWMDGGTPGSFQLCASRTDSPPGICDYTLSMTDAAGDGWGGSTVTVCIDPVGTPDPVCTAYTVTGSVGSITFGANEGDEVQLSYEAAGGFQGQIGYQLSAPGGILLDVPAFPMEGVNIAFTVTPDCNTPPPSQSDCVGGLPICAGGDYGGVPEDIGNVNDLNAENRGCLIMNELHGEWYRLTVVTSGTLVFQIAPAEDQDYDFAVWGPYTGEVVCPPANEPLRCSFSSNSGNTGLNFSETDVSEGAGGNSFLRYIDALAGETYTLYVANFTQGGVPFNISFDPGMTAEIDCIVTGAGPAREVATLSVYPNPANDHLMITTSSGAGMMDWHVLDASGRVVLAGRDVWASGSTNTIAIDRLEQGSYVLRMCDAQGTIGVARFVKE